MPNNSLFFARNSLFLRNNSLLPNRRVPHQCTVKWRLSRSKGGLRGPGSSKFPVIFPVSREFAVEKGSRWTAPTASHPPMVLSVERHFAKWQGVGPFQVSTDTTSEQTELKIGLPGADSENFSGCPDGSVGSQDRASQRPNRTSH